MNSFCAESFCGTNLFCLLHLQLSHNATGPYLAGNVRFRKMIFDSSEAYLAASTGAERNRLVQSIIDSVHAQGGRFLRKHQVNHNVRKQIWKSRKMWQEHLTYILPIDPICYSSILLVD